MTENIPYPAEDWLYYAEVTPGIKIDLGCGRQPKPGFVGVDFERVRPGVVADIEHPLPFETSSITAIWCDQLLEHIRNLIELMNECHRILEYGGWMWIGVPRFPEPESVIDPTHVRFFVAGTFDYFCSPSSKFDYGIRMWERLHLSTPAWGIICVLRKPYPIAI